MLRKAKETVEEPWFGSFTPYDPNAPAALVIESDGSDRSDRSDRSDGLPVPEAVAAVPNTYPAGRTYEGFLYEELTTLEATLTATGSAGVILAPAASARNVILPTGDFIPLTLTGVSGQTANLLEVVENNGNVAFKLGASGKPTITKQLALTTTVSDVLELGHNSTATPAGGFGSRTLWKLESDTTAGREAFDTTTIWATVTDASRKARTSFNAWDTAARECIRIEATGAAAMVGFLGAAAVVRQTLGAAATDAGTTQTLANNIRTALINLGLGAA
jgi:hypothetical protein